MTTNKPMTMKKIFLTISLFLLVLTCFRVGWIIYHKPPEHPGVEQGFVDLRDWTFNDNEAITLNGEWEFYPNEFLPSGSVQNQNAELISVPENWLNTPFFDRKQHPFGYGTYRLKVLLPDDKQQIYGIRMTSVDTAAKVYINSLLVAESGNPSDSIHTYQGKFGPFSGSFHPENNEIEIIIHVSNYDNFLSGGINKSIYIGTDTAINKVGGLSRTLQIVVSVFFLLHCMYVFIIYLIGKGKYRKELFYYGLMLAFAAFANLIDDDIVIHLPVSYVWSVKILLLFFLITLFCLLAFIKHLFRLKSRFYRFLSFLFLFLIVFILFVPFEYFPYIQMVGYIFYLLSILFLFYHTIKTIRHGNPDSIFILIFITSYTSNILWGAGIKFADFEIVYYPFDFLIYIIAIAVLLFKQHIRVVSLNEEQTKQLQKMDKMKDEFLANTSHELRNPLHGILNIAEATIENDHLSKESKENLLLLIDIGKRMSYTLNDLTAVTQLKEGKINLQKQETNLHMVASLVIDMLGFLREGKKVKLKSMVPANFPFLLADENRLIQILFNLVHNAIKYTEKGSIIIEADHSDSMATIYVKDTGIGIPTNLSMEKIFQPYGRADENTAISGIGIGLSVSKQLVDLHGGTITYTSTDKGTTFSFSIPLASEKEKTSLPMEHTNSFEEIAITNEANTIFIKQKATVLIVDDDPINVKVYHQMLANDYNVIKALNGREALEMIDENRVDLVLSDVMMPNMNGYELTKKIRKQYTLSELPIILVTARNLQEDIYTAFKSGANDYLIKPVNTLELKSRVEALTELKHSVKELLRLEAAWLQAQIHPHFLFNTLNSIASLAEIDQERMVALLEAFGDYLQKSFAISNIEAEIPIKDELELTRSYLHIEKERFGERIQVVFDIGDNIDIHIPPLSIQPLVENAVEHGILQKKKGGIIWIRVIELKHDIKIEIEDNGVGINEDKAIELLDLQYSLHDDGVGIKNTNRRLTQLYGKGLQINSVVGEGTTITFFIPRVDK